MTLWTGTDWIGIDENGEGYALGGEPIPDSLALSRAGEAGKAAPVTSVSYSAQATLFFPALEA